ncbi:hypothetical protein M9458_009997, partial [Cirrhinus mrigala]
KHDIFHLQETSPPTSKSPSGRNLIRDSGSSISITTVTDQPGFLFPIVRTTPITVRRKKIEESSLSWSPEQNKSRNETKRPLIRLVPEDSGQRPNSNMLVTDVYYEDVPNTSTTTTTPVQNNDQDQETSTTTAKPLTTTSKPAENATSAANASTATTGSAISASMKIISQTTQPLFNGKTL